jgi:hypothetical protein
MRRLTLEQTDGDQRRSWTTSRSNSETTWYDLRSLPCSLKLGHRLPAGRRDERVSMCACSVRGRAVCRNWTAKSRLSCASARSWRWMPGTAKFSKQCPTLQVLRGHIVATTSPSSQLGKHLHLPPLLLPAIAFDDQRPVRPFCRNPPTSIITSSSMEPAQSCSNTSMGPTAVLQLSITVLP